MCECDEGLVSKLEQDFKTTLEQHNTLEQWATWLECVCNTVLKQYEGGPQFSKAARQFLLKWSFYRCVFMCCGVSGHQVYISCTDLPLFAMVHG